MLYLSTVPWQSDVFYLIASDKGVVYFGNDTLEALKARYKDIHTDKQADDFNQHYLDDLERYFNGDLKKFDWKYDLRGTDFQQEVWHVLQTIPYGETTTYGAVAKAVNRPKASRAVGGAVGRNPVTIAIPCHRVIGQNGMLTGFGCGLEVKRALFDIEGIPYKD